MKHLRFSNLAGLGALLLILGTAPGAFPGQGQSQAPSKPAPPAPPSAPLSSMDALCAELDSVTELLDNELRINEQELETKVALLQDQIEKEVEMSSPEMQKLQNLSAELESKSEEIEAQTEEASSRAEKLAEEAQESAAQAVKVEPRVFVTTSDEDSGWLGIEINEVTAEKAKDLKLSSVRGVIVSGIEPDSPAAKAGLKEDDVITQYDGQVIEGTVQFRRLVRETPPGRTVKLTISRDGGSKSISVELGDRSAFFEKKMEGKMRDFGNAHVFSIPNFDFHVGTPDSFAPLDWRTPLLGISAEDLSGQLGSYFGAPDDAGILVREVRPGTPAEKAGLKAGDVIIKVDGKAVQTLGALREQLRDKTDQKTIALGILRKGSEMSVSVTIEKPRPIEPMHMIHRTQL